MNKFLFPLTAVALCFTAHQAMAAAVTSSAANAKAKIIAPLSITVGTDELNFGTMLSGANTVTVGTNGGRTATDNTLLVTSTTSAGSFTAVNGGTEAVNATLTLPPSATVTRSGGSETMTVSNFKSDFGDGSQSIPTTNKPFHVGADLTVGANQAAGEYLGTYTVKLDY